METLHPGLYVQEVMGSAPMEGVSTSTGAFLGTAPTGRIGEPVFITSWNQYVDEFGSFSADSNLAYAVRGFFANGGKRCYVGRVVHTDKGVKASSPASLNLSTDKTHGSKVCARIMAKSDGEWGNKITIQVKKGSDETKFSIIAKLGEVTETYLDLDVKTVEETLHGSKLIKFTNLEPGVPDEVSKSLEGGKDGLEIVDSDYIGDPAYKTGMHIFDGVKINMLAIPGVTSTSVLKGAVTYVESRKDCIAVLDVPKGQSPSEVHEFVTKTANLSSDYAVTYYPWVNVADPIGVGKSPIKTVPPSGHVMGVIARTDSNVGCWRAPAGTDAKVNGIVSLEYETSDNEQDLLNPDCINCIRSFPGDGTIVFGARTLSKGEYKYLPVRRIAIFVEQSILANLRWTVFKPNDHKLWDASKNSVEHFLNGLWAQGGLKGSSSKEAFFVVCDDSNNSKDTIDEGKMFVDLGICPLKPAEFVIFRLSLKR